MGVLQIFFLFCLFIVLPILFLAACDSKPRTAFDDYGDAITGSYVKGQHAGKTGNLDAVRKAVSMYHAEHGFYPETLEDIQESIRLDVDMSQFEYNPENGDVSLVK